MDGVGAAGSEAETLVGGEVVGVEISAGDKVAGVEASVGDGIAGVEALVRKAPEMPTAVEEGSTWMEDLATSEEIGDGRIVKVGDGREDSDPRSGEPTLGTLGREVVVPFNPKERGVVPLMLKGALVFLLAVDCKLVDRV